MKVTAKELVNNKNFLGHVVIACMDKEARATINYDDKVRDENGDYHHDVILSFNGVELDIRKFCKRLEDEYDRLVLKESKPYALELFEKFKQDYKSKNSNNAKLSKIKGQLDKVNNQLINVTNSIKELN